jgi:aminoglycoside 6'-N-acetyltransferase
MSAADPVLTSGGGIAVRSCRDRTEDYERLHRWRGAPHVAEWWWTDDDPAEPTLDEVIAHYRPGVRGETPTTVCLIEAEAEPIGFLQFYPWSAYSAELDAMGATLPSNYWGVDIFIGEAALVGKGYGSRAVSLITDYLKQQRGAAGIALVVSRANARAQRAYEKAGLRRTQGVLDTDRRHGERIASYLMVTPEPD